MERLKGEASFWYPYMRILPKSFDVTVFWTEAELSELQDDNIIQAAVNQQAWKKSREKSGDLGTEVHSLIEHSCKRILGFIEPRPDVSDEAIAVYGDWDRWARDVRLQPVVAEKAVASLTHRFAGRFDLVAWVEGRLSLLDWKTSKDVYPEMRMQSAAYRQGLREHGWPEMDAHIVRLPKDGGRIHAVKVEEPVADLFRAFLGALEMHRFLKGYEK